MTINWLSGKKIYIWGTGEVGLRAYHHLLHVADIVGFLDENAVKWGDTFCGKHVYRRTKESGEDGIIVVASAAWRKMVPALIREGKIPFKDFVPYEFFYSPLDTYRRVADLFEMVGWSDEALDAYIQDKKLVVIYGRGYMHCALKYCAYSDEFMKEYLPMLVPDPDWFFSPFLEGRRWLGRFGNEKKLLERIDILLYQADNMVPDENLYSVRRFKERLSGTCECISLPSLKFYGYFPQAKPGDDLPVTAGVYRTRFSDVNIDSCLSEGMDASDIYERVMASDFYSADEIEGHIKKTLEDIREDTDIRIDDWIEENYGRFLLFHSPIVPTYRVLYEMAKRIMARLGISDVADMEMLDDEVRLHIYISCGIATDGVLLYPAVADFIGLDMESNGKMIPYNSGSGVFEYIDYKAYIRRYAQEYTK